MSPTVNEQGVRLGTSKCWVVALSAISSASCASEPAGSPRDDGEPCQWSAECASGLCVPERLGDETTGWSDGMCVSACDDRCAQGGVCVRFDAEALCVPSCEGADACRDGYVCEDSLRACLPDCRLGWDCGAQLVCDGADGQCRLPVSPGAGFGEPCASGADCASLVCIAGRDADGQATGWGDGLCSASCASAACPSGGTCARLGEYLLCVRACAEGAACAEGLVCSEALGACLPDCRLGWGCGVGFVCDPSGVCVIESVVPVAIGAPCEASADCASGVCFDSLGWTDGMCSAPCGSALCGAETGCAILEDAAWCLPSCASGCRAGYVCDPDYQVCLPDCRAGWPCLGTFVCSADSGVCVAPTSGDLWSACDGDLACASGVCVPDPEADASLVQGRCSLACEASCPVGFACVTLGSERVCTPSCSGQGDCPQTWVCEPRLDACAPSCQAGWPCAAGEQCNASGLCRSGGPGGP